MGHDPKRILLTGGAGFIGTHLAEALLAQGHEVVILDSLRRNSLRYAPDLKSSGAVRFLTGDIRDAECVRQAVSGCQVVLHLAAIAGVSSYYDQALDTLSVNILGTQQLLEACAAVGIERFVHFSTSEVFGSDALWVNESSIHGIGAVTDRRWVYATSKLAGEHFALRYGERHQFAVAVVRPFNVYGPRQTGEGAIRNFCRAALDRQPLVVYGDGSALRAWCYIDDFVRGVMAVLRCAGDADVFNIGNPQEVETTRGLARRIAALVPGSRIEYRPAGRAEVRARVPDIEKARSLLGFQPCVSLEDGLKLSLDWYRGEQDA